MLLEKVGVVSLNRICGSDFSKAKIFGVFEDNVIEKFVLSEL